MSSPAIIFPHIGISIPDFSSSVKVFGIDITFYGIIIAVGMICGVLLAFFRAKKTGQKADDYIDIAIFTIIAGIIGARLYYVLFSLDYYLENPGQILNIRNGGLAIYGGVIAGAIAMFIVTKVKKISILQVFDTCAPGVALAQAFGRWGNFFNREAFGDYTDSLFAMQIKLSDVSGVVTDNIREHIVYIDGVQYIQVHPAFLYESCWCLIICILIIIFRKYQKYNGEIILWYIGGYAMERTFVEGLRTDSLMLGNSGIAISQLLSILLFVAALTILIINRIRLFKKTFTPNYPYQRKNEKK